MKLTTLGATLLFVVCINLKSNAQTQEIKLPLVVTDNQGHFLTWLPTESLIVTQDKKPLKLISVNSDFDQPLYIAIIAEWSRALPTYANGSSCPTFYCYPYQDIAFEEGMMVYGFVKNARPDDQIAFATFDRQLHIMQDFTTNRTSIMEQVDSMLNNTLGPMMENSGSTETVASLLKHLVSEHSTKKIIVVWLGTGQDTFGNEYTELLAQERRDGIQTFFVRVGWQAVQNLDEYCEALNRSGVPPIDSGIPGAGCNSGFGGIRMYFKLYAVRAANAAKASGGQAYELRIPTQNDNFSQDILMWAQSKMTLVCEAPVITDNKVHKIKAILVPTWTWTSENGHQSVSNGKVKAEEGKFHKLELYSIDGRTRP